MYLGSVYQIPYAALHLSHDNNGQEPNHEKICFTTNYNLEASSESQHTRLVFS